HPDSYKGNELAGRLFLIDGNHQKALHHWLKLLKQDHPLNYLYIPKIMEMRVDSLERQKLIAHFLALARKTRYPFIKNLLQYYLSKLYRENHHLKSSRRLIHKMGWITHWKIIGPFDNDRQSRFNRPYPPEHEIDYKKEYQGKRVPIAFRTLPFADYDGSISLKSFFYPNNGVIAYGVTYIYSNKSRLVDLHTGSTDGIKIWLNDQLLLRDREKKTYAIDQYRLEAKLNKGWNKLLFKSAVENKEPTMSKSWRVGLRITKLGKPVNGLRITTHPKPYKSLSDGSYVSKNPHYAFPKVLKSYLKGQTTDSKLDTPYYLSMWAVTHHFKNQAITNLEELIKDRPKSSHLWNLLGEAYYSNEEWGKAVSAFKKSIRLDKNQHMAHFNLARYYFRKSLYDKSLAKFKSLMNLTKQNIDVYIYLISLYNIKRWYYDALLTAQQMVKAFPHSYLSHIYSGKQYSRLRQWQKAQKEYHKSIRLNYSQSYAREKVYKLSIQKDQFKTALKSLKRLIFLYPSEIRYRLNLSKLFIKGMKYRLALNVLNRLKKLSPHHPALHQLMGNIYYRMGKRRLSLKSYKLSLKYRPENLKLREYLDFLSPRDYQFIKRYDLNDEEVRQIISSAPKVNSHPKTKGVILLKRQLIEVFKSGAYYYQIHYIIQITNKSGVKKFNQIRIPKKMDKLLKAVTITPDGRELEATVFERGKISFPSLEVGSIIEYKYIVEHERGEWLEDHFYTLFYFQRNSPILRAELILSIPKSKKHKIFVSDPAIQQKKDHYKDRWIYQWISLNNNPIYEEKFRPPFRDLARKVMISTIPSWKRIAEWQKSLISDQFTIDNSIKDKIMDLTKDKTSLEEKMKAIFYYVSNHIYYLYNDVGIFGKMPNRCTKVFNNKFGDCKDKGTLLIAMLKEIGVKAYYAGIRTNDRGQLIRRIPASQTNHIITYIPEQKGIKDGFFLDSTSELYPYKYLRPNSQGVWAIVLKGKDFEIMKTPSYPPQRTLAKLEYKLSFVNKVLKVQADLTAYGYYARRIRRKYRIKDKRKELLEKFFNKKLNGVEGLEASFSDLKEVDTPVKIESHFQVKDYIKNLDNTLQFNTFHHFNLTSTFTAKEEREHDLEFLYSFQKEIVQTLKIPDGYHLAHKPKSFSFRLNDLFFCSIQYKIEGNKVVCHKVLSIKKGKILLKDYTRFRKLCIQLDQSDQDTLTFVPVSTN
ncbi:MAG TPA: DUF3857 domain-containing protein, partial [Spirochaetes bacterium]|nr:DUF3857 domain-containing protein [Spirochaetota bacterium]